MVKRPISVLHVVLSLEPGGMENGVVNLANGLAREEFLLRVCCLIRPGAFAVRLSQKDGVVSLDKKPGFSWEAVQKLRAHFRESRPDIIHTHNLGTLIYTVLALRGNSTVPILHGEHAEFSTEDLSLRRRLQRRLFYQPVSKIVPVSQSLGEHLIEHGAPAGKVFPIDNGVDTDRFVPSDRQSARRALGIPEDARVLGIVGRFGPYKRHDLLIAAFNRLVGQNADLHLLVVGGGGPREGEIKNLAAQSPHASRIHLAGFQQDTRRYYQAMDLLVIPSYNEGMSNAALEAMATALPVLCHNACGHADLIIDGQNGYVRQIAGAEQFAKDMQTLLDQPEKLLLAGKAAREFVVNNYSLHSMLEKYAGLYRQTAGVIADRETG